MKTRSFHLRQLLFLTVVLGGTLGSSLKPDEVVTFFPTFAAQSADGKSLNVNIHAWVYEPEDSSRSRNALLSLLSKRLGLPAGMSESKMFRDRAKPFLVDNESGKNVSLRLGGDIFELGPSSANGHIVTTLTIPLAKLQQTIAAEGAISDHPVQFKVEILGQHAGESSFTIPFITPDGVSVISDLDDTIKISEVGNRRALLRNTFCQEFRPIPGMAKLYQTWAEQGASFHYVSASPWQLHTLIRDFLEAHGFPRGSMFLKTFRWKDSSFFELFAKSDEVKKPFIESILKAFPKRKFILVGDSGELDPELYAALARGHSGQVKKILILNSTGESVSSARWNRAFDGLPSEIWSVFSDPAELQGKTLAALAQQQGPL